MSPATVAIVLIAAVAHAVWNLASTFKRGDTVVFVAAYTALSALLCLPFAIGGQITGPQPLTPSRILASAGPAPLPVPVSPPPQAGGGPRAPPGVVPLPPGPRAAHSRNNPPPSFPPPPAPRASPAAGRPPPRRRGTTGPCSPLPTTATNRSTA